MQINGLPDGYWEIVFKDGWPGMRMVPAIGAVLGPDTPRRKEFLLSRGNVTVTRDSRRINQCPDDTEFEIDGGDPEYENPDSVYLSREEAEAVVEMLREALDAPEEWV